jgi:hypothetical protein
VVTDAFGRSSDGTDPYDLQSYGSELSAPSSVRIVRCQDASLALPCAADILSRSLGDVVLHLNGQVFKAD